jgi:hypothetical protein
MLKFRGKLHLPASNLDKSRISLMSDSSFLPATWIFCKSAVNFLHALIGGFLLQHLGVAQEWR